jgi:predicted metal-binding membrane protein
MNVETPSARIIRLHKKWADGFTVVWHLLTLVVFGAVYVFLDRSGVSPVDRNSALILLGVMLLMTALWQATGLAIARIHMLLDGVDLEHKSKRIG